jgi:hypothetical protein
MQRNFKHMWSTLTASLIAFTSLVNAQVDNAHMRNLENRVSALEQRRGSSGMINPPGRPQVKGGADLFVFGNLLYWNAHENGLSYAIVNKGSSTNLANAQVKNNHGKWNWAFRAGVGYNLPHDGWDVNLTWLRFTDHGFKRKHAHGNEVIFPVGTHPADPLAETATANKAHGKWYLNLNQLDLDLGREFFVSKWLTVRPHFGLRTNWIRQKIHNDYNNFIGAQVPNQVKLKIKDDWYGIGLEGGLDTQWGLGNGFSIFGNLASAIIYGFHDFDYDEEDSPFSARGIEDFVDLDNSYRISHAILDLAMGLRYDCMFNDDRFHLGLQLGWEHHIYFSQNQFPVFVDSNSLGSFVRNQGDLTLQGWTFAARFDF